MMIKWHIFLSTLALFIMVLAGIQAGLLSLQDYFLRHDKTTRFLRYLPPLETMEKRLFRLITFGFCILSLVMITSLLFFHPLMAPAFRQKFLLTFIAWGVFAGLLLGHFYSGWRGRIAIRFTLTGVILLLIIYCGTGLLTHALN